MSFIYAIIVGLISGWGANSILGNDSSNLIMNLILGVIGSYVGGLVGGLIGIHASNIIGSCIIGILGAVLVIWLYNKFIKKK